MAVGAHPDDAEIGLGGTLALMARRGWRAAILDLTNGEPTPRGSVETRAAEAAEAARVLGVERRTLDLPNRYLFDSREARETVAAVFREWRPRIVVVPWWEDAHPDHIAACRIAEAARFYAKLTKTEMPHEPYYPPRFLYYWASHLKSLPQSSVVIDITVSIDDKMAALDAYASQFGEGTAREDFFGRVRNGAGLLGRLAGVGSGEAIIAREPLGLDGLDGLV